MTRKNFHNKTNSYDKILMLNLSKFIKQFRVKKKNPVYGVKVWCIPLTALSNASALINVKL